MLITKSNNIHRANNLYAKSPPPHPPPPHTNTYPPPPKHSYPHKTTTRGWQTPDFVLQKIVPNLEPRLVMGVSSTHRFQQSNQCNSGEFGIENPNKCEKQHSSISIDN
jgi:hypothetical protein